VSFINKAELVDAVAKSANLTKAAADKLPEGEKLEKKDNK